MEFLVQRVIFILTVILSLIILGKIISTTTHLSCTLDMRLREYFTRQPSVVCEERSVSIKSTVQTDIARSIQQELLSCMNTYLHDPNRHLGIGRYCIPCSTITLPSKADYTTLKDTYLTPPVLGTNGKRGISIIQFLTTRLPPDWIAKKDSDAFFNPLFSRTDADTITRLGPSRKWRIYYYQNYYPRASIKNPSFRVRETAWETLLILPATGEGDRLAQEKCATILATRQKDAT